MAIAIHVLYVWIPHPLPKFAVFLIIGISIVILIWQITGTLRSCERNLKGGGDMILYWGCYGASIMAAIVLAVDTTSLVSSISDPNPLPATPTVELAVQGNTVLIEGFIGFRTHTALLAVLDDPDKKITTARLSSDGGRIFAARAIANALIAHSINTEVSDRCASACTLVFLAGVQRHLLNKGQLGFHQYSQTSSVQLLDTIEEQEKDRTYFRQRGVSEAFIESMFQAKHQDIWFPEYSELLAAGILTD